MTSKQREHFSISITVSNKFSSAACQSTSCALRKHKSHKRSGNYCFVLDKLKRYECISGTYFPSWDTQIVLRGNLRHTQISSDALTLAFVCGNTVLRTNPGPGEGKSKTPKNTQSSYKYQWTARSSNFWH